MQAGQNALRAYENRTDRGQIIIVDSRAYIVLHTIIVCAVQNSFEPYLAKNFISVRDTGLVKYRVYTLNSQLRSDLRGTRTN